MPPAFMALDRRLRNDGVDGPILNVDAVLRAGSREGVDDAIESLETEREDSNPLSLSSSISARQSSSSSSAGSSRMSNGVRNFSDGEGEVPSSLHSCTNSSIVTLLGCWRGRRARDFGGGIAVTASSAATAGGIALGS